MPYRGGEPLAEVVRSGFVEGVHHGSVVALGPDETVAFAKGDVHGAIFPRSSNKPMQAVAMLRAGLELTDPADLAIVSASHFGESMHVARVRGLLARGGLDESDLRCPADLPLSEAARTALLLANGGRQRVYMNCSGKHAGMLLTCVHNGWSRSDYLDPRHPLQVACEGVVEEFAGEPIAATGVDGCGAPVFAVSLVGLARAFLRIVTGPAGSPQRRVADAMRANPELCSGVGADDARLMGSVPGLLSKVGAEGVLAAAVPGRGAVALKIDDGGGRARLPVLVQALERLGVIEPRLDELATIPILGGGTPVGEVRWTRSEVPSTRSPVLS